MKGLTPRLHAIWIAYSDGCTDRQMLALRFRLTLNQVYVYLHRIRLAGYHIPHERRVSSEFAPGFHQ